MIYEHEFEATYLTNKNNKLILLEDDFYGDPTCGFIADDETYALIGGDHLTIWTPRKSKRFDDGPHWTHAIREKDQMTAEFLTDPWHKDSAIWEIDIETLELKKIRDFLDYQGKEYTENVKVDL
ncbi:MAG: hypothetical protein CMP48_22910 [Rickettsiales bacterium]|nr:hypothetical protein [Rickettsiales bacterium]